MTTEFEIHENFDKIFANSPCYREINEIKSLENISYNDFFTNYLAKNIPCIIRNITHWECSKLWINAENNTLNLDYLSKQYGNCDVMIYNCNERYYNSQNTREAKFEDYITYLRNKQSNDTLEYLKDWHLKLQHPDDNFYEVPIYFASDWLNEYFLACRHDDYRFVYIGVKNTWTPFHADVFTSYSWSANVFGTKKWILFPPSEENHLKDVLGNLPYDISQVKHERKCFEVIQRSGDAIFVPSGWYHQVWNLEDTVSVNHNWINGCNICIMFESMKRTYLEVIEEISDCRDMENFHEHCQVMLKSTFGMNFKEFVEFLKCIVENRLDMLKNNKPMFHGKKMGKNHIIFDLNCLKNVLKDVIDCYEIKNIYFDIRELCEKLLNKIKDENNI